MQLVSTRGSLSYFTFTHNKSYQEVQFSFFDAVESLRPENIMVELRQRACSAVNLTMCVFSGSPSTSSLPHRLATAAERSVSHEWWLADGDRVDRCQTFHVMFISCLHKCSTTFSTLTSERALFAFESSFHSLFSLTQGTSRLSFRNPENRFQTPSSFT